MSPVGRVIELWREAGVSGSLPVADDVKAARAESGWSHFNLSDDGVVKTKAIAKIDLGGIAKGYAIDLAAGAMRACGVEGGMVDVGGDIRCFGRPADADEWIAQVRDPSGVGALGQFRLGQGAVCTSGDYARFVELDGERYSHIIDPRTGLPAKASSVTVVAPDAITADTWATALSVLGPVGLERLPPERRGTPRARSIRITTVHRHRPFFAILAVDRGSTILLFRTNL